MRVYFIQNTTTKAIKIGYSTSPEDRLKSLQTASESPLSLLGVIVGGMDRERELHACFSESRIINEWFSGAIQPSVMAIIAEGASAVECDEKAEVARLAKREADFNRERDKDLISGKSLEEGFGWDRGQAEKMAKKRLLPHYVLPSGDLLFDVNEIIDMATYVPAKE